MEYRIDSSELRNFGLPRIVLVGCGGTGSLVAEGLCRMLGKELELTLFDMDRVEEHNLLRQAFLTEDIGRYKAEALGKRLAYQYRVPVRYCTQPYDVNLLNSQTFSGFIRSPVRTLIIGAVDNAWARRSLTNIPMYSWWMDAGNGKNSGQVLIGNTTKLDDLKNSFDDFTRTIQRLPAPSLQQPTLLIPPPMPEKPVDCAQAIDEGQNPLINQAMAVLVLEFTRLLLADKLKWMQAYIDLDVGSLNYVQATPQLVAKMFSLKEKSLINEGCHIGHLSAMRLPAEEDEDD